ncbi:MAG: SPOR domain-containing protein [Pseudomonadota bacterium]
MSEELGPEELAKTNEPIEDDPLAELARIVAGEEEPAPSTRIAAVREEGVEAETALDEVAAELAKPETELVDAPEVLEPSDPEVSEELDPMAEFEQARDELERALANEVGELPIAGAAEAFEPDLSELDSFADELEQVIADNTPDKPEVSDEVSDEVETVSTAIEMPETADNFQDDLISALQQEIEQPEANPSEMAEDAAVSQFEVIDEALTDIESANSGYVDPQLEESVQEEYQSDSASAEPAQIDVEADFKPEPLPLAGEDVAEEDLGAVFTNEFENMLANEPLSGAVQGDAGDTELDASQNVVGADAGGFQDLDFSSAFAEELGVERVTEAEGWDAEDTATANAAFAEAAQPSSANLAMEGIPQMDPGHAGTIPVGVEGNGVGTAANEGGGSSRKYTIAALVIALFAGTIAAGYGFLGGGSGIQDSEPRLIKAESTPFKVKPEDPGGREPANQDNASYERVAGEDSNKIEQPSLISETEAPADIAEETLQVVEEPESNLAVKSDERLTTSNEDTAAANTEQSGSVEPRVVQTVVVKPDGTIVTTTEPEVAASEGEAASVPSATDLVSDRLQVASNSVSEVSEAIQPIGEGVIAPKPVETVTISNPETTEPAEPLKPAGIDGANSTGQIAVPEASPLPKPAPAPKPVETAAATPTPDPAPAATSVRRSEWVVQVSSQRSPEAAQASFQNLRSRFNVLQGRSMSIQRANVNGATFYRVRVQTASRNDANQLCASLQASGGSCFVTR